MTRFAPSISAFVACSLAVLLFAAPTAHAQSARRILEMTGVKGGLVVHVGCKDGALTTALKANDRIVVHGFDRDLNQVERARERVRRMGLASRVWIDRLDGDRLPYGENMVNLLVASGNRVSREEMMRVVAPGGTVLYEKDGKWERVVKPWPKGIDEWTHWLHGPDRNAVAQDLVAGPPRRLKWIAAPLWSRSHDSVPSVTSMVSSGGRLFYIVDEAPASMSGAVPDQWALVARDAFNGLELWRIPLADWGWKSWATRSTVRFTIPTHMPRRLVAVGDRVYVTLGFNAPLTELDAATGEVLRTFEGTDFTDEILFIDDTLVVAVNQGRQQPGPKEKDAKAPEPVRKWVAAVDAKSGRTRWKTGDFIGLRSKTGSMERISHLSMAADKGQVFFVDGNEIISLSLADGRERWRISRPEAPEHKMRYNIRISDMCSPMVHDGMVYFVQLNPDRTIDWREVRGKLHAFSAGTGKEVWSRECSSWGWAHPADVFAMNGLVWVSGFKEDFYLGLDPKTGEVRRKVSNLKAFDNAHHHRCYRNKATVNYLVTSFRGLEFIDLKSKETDRNHWVRGICRLGVLPCNGMVYASPHPCDCYITSKLKGFLGLEPAKAGGLGIENKVLSDQRLEKGSAFLG
ncbi:PQQ-binding-like beta-propeller repeat protein, partial [bacterium]|nr:PQQ-binding-like beta-propeller repeat protein [bacterium]